MVSGNNDETIAPERSALLSTNFWRFLLWRDIEMIGTAIEQYDRFTKVIQRRTQRTYSTRMEYTMNTAAVNRKIAITVIV